MDKFKKWRYFIKPDKQQKKILNKVIDLWVQFLDWTLREWKFLIYKDANFFLNYVNEEIPKESRSIDDTFEILKEVAKYSISQSDLNYLAFPDSWNSLPAMMGTLFSKFLNQNLIGVDRSAPIATFIEIQLIEWFRWLVWYDTKPLKEIKSLSEVSWMWTTWGHLSNHIAILSALNKNFPKIKEEGLSWLKVKPVILVSKKISHYSIESAVIHLWIGKENIIDIPTLPNFTTDFEALEEIINSLPNNKKPFMIISVAWNTRTSSLDDLENISIFAKEHDLWNHVDACHWGSLLFSKKHITTYLKWIENADSVTIDPHKWLFVTYPSSYVIFKQRDTLTMFTRYPKECRDGSNWDLWLITPFLWSRWFESLNIWLMIKIMWLKWIEKTILDREKIAKYAEKLIIDSWNFITLNDMDFYRMAFVYIPNNIKEYIKKYINELEDVKVIEIQKLIDNYNHSINQSLYVLWELCLDEYKLHDVWNRVWFWVNYRYTVMAITIWNPLYTKKSINESLNKLFDKAKNLEDKMINDFNNIIIGINSNGNEKQASKVKWPAWW